MVYMTQKTILSKHFCPPGTPFATFRHSETAPHCQFGPNGQHSLVNLECSVFPSDVITYKGKNKPKRFFSPKARVQQAMFQVSFVEVTT